MMGWSEPHGFPSDHSALVTSGRYGTGLTPSLNKTMSVRVADVGEFVSEDNMSASVRNVAVEAGQLTREGTKLAAKGAFFSSRAKLVRALELIADARDAKHQTQFHSRALAAGLIALSEADDFSRPDDTTNAGFDPVLLSAGHTTSLLKSAQARHCDAIAGTPALLFFRHDSALRSGQRDFRGLDGPVLPGPAAAVFGREC